MDNAAPACSAARHAIDATQELMRYAREGAVCNWPFGDVDVAAELASALCLTLEIELDHISEELQPNLGAERESRGQLLAAARKFLLDSCGIDLPNLPEQAHA